MVTVEQLRARCRAAGIAVSIFDCVRAVDAATILAVTPRVLRDYRDEGKPPAYLKRNGAVWYSLAALCEYWNASDD